MISLHNVEKVYRTARMETRALSQINLEIESGEFVSVMGPSGCGKSTLLNVMGLLDAPSEGDVVLDGEKVQGYKDRALARLRNRKIGFVFRLRRRPIAVMCVWACPDIGTTRSSRVSRKVSPSWSKGRLSSSRS